MKKGLFPKGAAWSLWLLLAIGFGMAILPHMSAERVPELVRVLVILAAIGAAWTAWLVVRDLVRAVGRR